MIPYALKVIGFEDYILIPDCEGSEIILSSSDCDLECLLTTSLWFQEGSFLKWAERPKNYLSLIDDTLCLSTNKNLAWNFHAENIKLKRCESDQSVKIAQKNEETIRFELIPKELPKPATSCHLRFGPELPDYSPEHVKKWSLKCTVQVEKSADCTYFMVTGFGPGGYCGIQQLPNNERKAIFSMWNEENISVYLVNAGEGVDVTEFGGEGTGIKTMRDFDWKEGDDITFQVDGQLIDGYWFVSCYYFVNENEQLMAKLRRSEKGGNPLSKTGFYSFVEDWNRCKDAKGYKIKRKARFLNPKFDGILLKNAQFTKVETGCDAYGADLARGKTCENGFILESGIEVCENNTVLHCNSENDSTASSCLLT